MSVCSFLVWGAAKTVVDPDISESSPENPNRLALDGLTLAADRLGNRWFDPQACWRDMLTYRQVKRARDLAGQGDLDQSIELFTSAREQGWRMLNEPARAAAQLFAVRTLFGDDRPTPRTDEEGRAIAAAINEAVKRFPDMRTGHRAVALFHAQRGEYAQAERHYSEEAAAKEHSAEPLALAANLALTQAKRSMTRRG